MKIRSLAISLLISTPGLGYSAPVTAPAPVPVAPAPYRPVLPAPVPSAPLAPSAPGQVPRVNQQVPRSPTPGETGQMAPQTGMPTNAFVPSAGQPMPTNGFAPQLANTNGFAPGNRFGSGFTNRFGGRNNRFGAFTNQFASSNVFGFVSNQFGTNLVLEDEGLTPQDRALVARIRRELLPLIRRERLPIHLVSQNGVVTMTGFAFSEQEAQQLAATVQHTPGVTTVNNELEVNPNFQPRGEIAHGQAHDQDNDDQAFSPVDRDLLKHLRGRMRRRHLERGASELVHIIARNRVITLAGFVGSAAEEQALVAAARSTPGVARVDDDLQVRAGPAQNQTPGTGLGTATSPYGTSTGGDASSGSTPFYPPPAQGSGSLTNTNTLTR